MRDKLAYFQLDYMDMLMSMHQKEKALRIPGKLTPDTHVAILHGSIDSLISLDEFLKRTVDDFAVISTQDKGLVYNHTNRISKILDDIIKQYDKLIKKYNVESLYKLGHSSHAVTEILLGRNSLKRIKKMLENFKRMMARNERF